MLFFISTTNVSPLLTMGAACIRCASSKHLQTRRFLDTLESYLREVQKILVHLHRAANAPPTPFLDHSGTLRDARTGRPINGHLSDENSESGDDDDAMSKRMHFISTFNIVL